MNARAITMTRNEHILSYYPLVCSIANKLKRQLPDSVELQELISVGMIGLIESYDRFDKSKGIPFISYAEIRIRGAMIDELRRQDWVPRSVRKRVQDRQNIQKWLEKKHGRKLSDQEMACELNISLTHFKRQRSRDQIMHCVSMETMVGGSENLTIKDQLKSLLSSPEESLEKTEFQKVLKNSIQSLNIRERTTIEMYYFHKKSLKEIGGILNVTESRACQIRAAAIKRLQKKISLFA